MGMGLQAQGWHRGSETPVPMVQHPVQLQVCARAPGGASEDQVVQVGEVAWEPESCVSWSEELGEGGYWGDQEIPDIC